MLDNPLRCIVCRRLTGSVAVELGGQRGHLCSSCAERVRRTDRPYQWSLWVGFIVFGLVASIIAAVTLIPAAWSRGDRGMMLNAALIFLSPVLSWVKLREATRLHMALRNALDPDATWLTGGRGDDGDKDRTL